MQCPQCYQENPPQANFCLACGVRLTLTCSACGTELPAGARFCLACGQPVQAPDTVQSRPAAPVAYTPKHLAERILTSRSALEGERKQVTVLFCDLTNSTALAERLGPEAMQLRWQSAQRIRSDYRARDSISAMTVRTSVELAEHIIANVEGYLRAQHS